MKKLQFFAWTLVLSLSLSLLFSCNNKQINSDQLSSQDSTQVSRALVAHDTMLLNLTQQVLTIIKNKDYTGFAELIHPTEGLRFTPYANIDTVRDIQLNRDQFLAGMKADNPMMWGHYDGNGNPISMTIAEYFSQFVYDHDFLNAKQISYNQMIGSGNSSNNLKEVYSVSDFTESHFPGFVKALDGHDWSSLRLVFGKNLDKYYLIGIVHDQWTI